MRPRLGSGAWKNGLSDVHPPNLEAPLWDMLITTRHTRQYTQAGAKHE